MLNLEKALPLSDGAPVFTNEGIAYQFIKTRDGSPSLRMWSADNHDRIGAQEMRSAEAMHHCDGALSESLYIYGSLIEEVFFSSLKILSVGLGCGYNEWIALAIMKSSNAEIKIESFESNPFLRKNFIEWLLRDNDSMLAKLFEETLNCVARHFEICASDLKTQGRELLNKDLWRINERLDSTVHFRQKFNVIFFDAFSAKCTPDLWKDDFLDWFLATAADQPCAFSTYAATGCLNRALKRNDFALVPYSGFSGKRQSTRAFR